MGMHDGQGWASPALCEICGVTPEYCDCPECPICGVLGNPECPDLCQAQESGLDD